MVTLFAMSSHIRLCSAFRDPSAASSPLRIPDQAPFMAERGDKVTRSIVLAGVHHAVCAEQNTVRPLTAPPRNRKSSNPLGWQRRGSGRMTGMRSEHLRIACEVHGSACTDGRSTATSKADHQAVKIFRL